MAWVRAWLCKLQKGVLDSQPKVARPWSVVLSGYPCFFYHKTGRHDIAEILLKVTLNTIKQIKSNNNSPSSTMIIIFQYHKNYPNQNKNKKNNVKRETTPISYVINYCVLCYQILCT